MWNPKKPRKAKINIELFKRLFYTENKTAVEISKIIGLCPSTIRQFRYDFKLPKKYCSGKNNKQWKGGKYLHGNGYRMVRVKAGEYMLEHRFIMSKHLRRPLRKSDVVHHVNGNKLDNRIENLELHTNSSHRKLHCPPGSKFGINSPKASCTNK